MDPIGKFRYRMADLSNEDVIEAFEAAGITDLNAMTVADQMRSTVALGWMVARRRYPDMTFADAMAQPFGTFQQLEEDEPGEGSGANDGVTPPASLAPGL